MPGMVIKSEIKSTSESHKCDFTKEIKEKKTFFIATN